MKEQFARAAYEAYSVAVGGKAYDGSPLKQYDEFPENIKKGWEAAGERVAEEVAKAFGMVWNGTVMVPAEGNGASDTKTDAPSSTEAAAQESASTDTQSSQAEKAA